MNRAKALYLVGGFTLLALAGCGGFKAFEQRDAWRGQAETACMRSGAVQAGSALVPMRPINGPGICGADQPFKVAAIGDRTILGYLQDMRPPGAIPRDFPIPEPRRQMPPDPAGYGAPPRGDTLRQDAADHDTAADEGDEQDGGVYSSGPPPAGSRGRGSSGDSAGFGSGSLPAFAAPRGNAPLSVGSAGVRPQATLACPLVARLDRWMSGTIQPAAMRWFGQPVAEIRQISAYSCRGMNGQPGARISEHAFGNALDIAAFTLADGRRVTVQHGWRGTPEEQGFLRDVHAGACELFSTVLAPGSNRFHYDHFHVDLARRRSGRQVCNPRAVPGDLIANRARERLVTGSTGRSGRMGFAAEEEAGGLTPQLPRAIPGED